MGGGPRTEGHREARAVGNRRGGTVLLACPSPGQDRGKGEEQAPEGLRLPPCLCCLLSPDTWFSSLPPAPHLPSRLCPSRPASPGFDLMAAFGLVEKEYASIRGVAMEPSAFGPTRTFTLFKDAQLTRRARSGRRGPGRRRAPWGGGVVGGGVPQAQRLHPRASQTDSRGDVGSGNPSSTD